MKLAKLKAETRDAWKFNCELAGVVPQWENYDSDIQQFGDRRRKETWIKALCHYTIRAQRLGDPYSPGILLIRLFSDDPNIRHFWYPEYRTALLDALMMMPSGARYLWQGLRQLNENFGKSNEYQGVFELVARAVGEPELSGPAGDGSQPAILLPVER